MSMGRKREVVYAPGRYGIDPEADRPKVKIFEPFTQFKIIFVYVPAALMLLHRIFS